MEVGRNTLWNGAIQEDMGKIYHSVHGWQSFKGRELVKQEPLGIEDSEILEGTTTKKNEKNVMQTPILSWILQVRICISMILCTRSLFSNDKYDFIPMIQ